MVIDILAIIIPSLCAYYVDGCVAAHNSCGAMLECVFCDDGWFSGCCAGEGVEEAEESIILWCDDGDPCTDDRLISGTNGACRMHQTVADGTVCDGTANQAVYGRCDVGTCRVQNWCAVTIDACAQNEGCATMLDCVFCNGMSYSACCAPEERACEYYLDFNSACQPGPTHEANTCSGVEGECSSLVNEFQDELNEIRAMCN